MAEITGRDTRESKRGKISARLAPRLEFFSRQKGWLQEHRTECDELYVEPALRFVEAIGPQVRSVSPTLRFEARVNGWNGWMTLPSR